MLVHDASTVELPAQWKLPLHVCSVPAVEGWSEKPALLTANGKIHVVWGCHLVNHGGELELLQVPWTWPALTSYLWLETWQQTVTHLLGPNEWEACMWLDAICFKVCQGLLLWKAELRAWTGKLLISKAALSERRLAKTPCSRKMACSAVSNSLWPPKTNLLTYWMLLALWQASARKGASSPMPL